MDSPLMGDEAQSRELPRRVRRLAWMPGRGLSSQYGKLCRPTRFAQISFACLLLSTGAFFYALLNLFLRWMAIDPFDVAFNSFPRNKDNQVPDDVYSARYFKSVMPVPCHSHNDYWRTTPLYAALGSGCVSVEADVWLREDELYVGHNAFALSDELTLQKTYITPLVQILTKMNAGLEDPSSADQARGVFYNSPTQPLTLLIDFKTQGDETLAHVASQLQPLRDRGWLTHWNGTAVVERPVRVVASGNAPFDLLTANASYRDVFYDAPLAALVDPADSPTGFVAPDGHYTTRYNPSNSYLASAKFSDAVGPLRNGRMSAWQLHALQGQIRAARQRGLVPRYWGTPRWPRALRDEIWAALVKEDVGLLSVDDLRAARKGDWGFWPQDGVGSRK